MRKLLSGILIVIMVGLAFASSMFVDTVRANKEVNGIITSDTTWTKANSPYTLAGPVAIAKDVTLTIEPGVQVFFNKQAYMQVNGTLVARGSSNERVSFIDGDTNEIIFMPSSKSWDEQTGTGSVLENWRSNTFKITVNGSSPKISSGNSQAMITINSGSPLITNNRLNGEATSLNIKGGTPIISGNRLSSYKIYVKGGSPIISSNTIVGFAIHQGYDVVGYSGTCIEASSGNPYISNNNITNCYTAIQIGNGVIQNNTLSGGKVITVVGSFSPTIKYNNIFGGAPKLALSEGANQNINAAYNWWGAANETIISQSIIDNKNDFNLGTVTFVPFLTEPNPQAMPETGIPAPTPTATSNPTPSQSASLSPTSTSNQSGEGIIAFLGLGLTLIVISLLSLITVLLVLIVIFLWKRSVNKT